MVSETCNIFGGNSEFSSTSVFYPSSGGYISLSNKLL